MRSDGGVQRLRSAIEIVTRSNAQLPIPPRGRDLTKGPPVSARNFPDFSNATICAGYFNISSSRDIVATEEFQFPESDGLILQHLAVLSSDETTLNGSVAGRTVPEPEACGVKVWVSDAAYPKSRLTPLMGSLTPGGGISFTAENMAEISVDRIVLQGQFDHLTVCLYGWPFDAQTDARVVQTKRLLSTGVRRRIARPPVSPSFIDVCPLDSTKFESGPTEASADIKVPISCQKSSEFGSRPDSLCLRPPSTDFAELVSSLYQPSSALQAVGAESTINVPNSTASSSPIVAYTEFLSVPSMQTLQEITCSFVPEIRLFVESASATASPPEDSSTPKWLAFLDHPTWRVLASLMLWPLQSPAANIYSKFLTFMYNHLCSSIKATNSATSSLDGRTKDVIQKLSTPALLPDIISSLAENAIPVFNPASATAAQTVACLQLLTAAMKECFWVADLVVHLQGARVVAKLAGIDISEPAFNPEEKEVPHALNPCHRVQVAALRLLVAFSGHRVGLQSLVELPEKCAVDDAAVYAPDEAFPNLSIYESLIFSATRRREYGRIQYRLAFTEIAFNVKLHSLINRCLSAAAAVQEKQADRQAVMALSTALAGLMPAVAWDPTRQQEFEEIGEGFSSSISSRLSRLSQVGSCRGERNDGLGPDNHPKSTEKTKEFFCHRFARLTESTNLIPLLIGSNYFLSSVREELLHRYGCLSNVSDDVTASVLNSRGTGSNYGGLSSQSGEHQARSNSVQSQLINLPLDQIMDEVQLISRRLLSWFLSSSVGAVTFLASPFSCTCRKCLATSSEGESSTVTTTEVLRQHIHTSLIDKLPISLKTEISRLSRSQHLFFRLLYTLPSKDPNGSTSLSRKRCRLHSTSEDQQQQVFISLNCLRDMSEFVAERKNAMAMLQLLRNDSLTLACTLAEVFKALATIQLKEINASIPGTDDSLLSFDGHAGTIAALKFICHIVVSLLKAPQSGEFTAQFASICGTIVAALGQVARECYTNISGGPEAYYNCLPSLSWGVVDLSVNAYDSLDTSSTLEDDARGGVMLKSLVPSSLFTGLRQVFMRDQAFAAEAVDIAVICLVINQAVAAAVGQDAAPDATALFAAPDAFPSPACNDFLPSKARVFKRLVATLQTLAASVSPNLLVPTSESVEIANSGGLIQSSVQQQSTATIAARLGGFAGTVGVPSLEIRWPEQRDLSDSDSAIASRKSASGGPHPVPSEWFSQCLTCLRLLIREATLNYDDRNSCSLIDASFGADQLAESIRANCIDDPVFALQESHNSLRPALCQILIGLAAAVASPARLCDTTQMEGVKATLWFESLKKSVAVAEATLHFVYILLDLILPSAPYPISPILTMKLASQRPLPSVSRFASTTGTSWIPGELTDSALRDSLILITAQLGQSWCQIARLHNLPIAATEVLDSISSSLDIACATFRLWICRCPNSAPSIISAITRHSRVEPSRFIVTPLLLTAIGGLSLVLPANETTISFSDSQPPIVALELTGAEGRNLEAVVGRLKQMYLLKRQMDSLRTGIGAGTANVAASAGAGSRLPPSMTTLTLSSRCYLPGLCEDALYGTGVPHYLRFHIPLVPPPLPRQQQNPGATAAAAHTQHPGNCGPAGYEWVRRRLGRLTVGHSADLLSQGIFKTDRSSAPTQQLPKLAALASAAASVATVDVPEWATWDRMRDLLFESLEEEAVEAAIESDRVAAVPLGLSPAAIATVTESRAQAREMTRMLMQETDLEEGRKHLTRLEKISREFKYLKVEEIGEIVNLLCLSAFTSNVFLHAATAHALAYLSLSEGPAILDILVFTANNTVETLSSFLARELVNNRRHGLSQLFLISRLFIFVNNAFSLFSTPMLEVVLCLTQLAGDGLKALQDVPVIDQSCPTYPVLMGLFDALLPAATRLLRSSLETFGQFILLLSRPISQQIASGLTPTAVPGAVTGDTGGHFAVGGGPGGKVSSGGKLRNAMISGQFVRSLERKPTAARGCSGTGIAVDLLASIRTCCQGLCAVLNQLPVAWEVSRRGVMGLETRNMEDDSLNWTGLSTSTIQDTLDALEVLSSSQLLCAASLFDIPASFVETYCETIQKYSASGIGITESQLIVSATPDPTIKLDSFIITVADAVTSYSTSVLPEILNFPPDNDLENTDLYKRQMILLSIVRSLLAIGHSLFSRCGITSAPLLLPFVTPDPITPELLGVATSQQVNKSLTLLLASFQKSSIHDESADVYGDLDAVLRGSTANTSTRKSPAPGSSLCWSAETDKKEPQHSIRESFMLSLLVGLQAMKNLLNTRMHAVSQRPELERIDRLVDLRIEELTELRRIVRDVLTPAAPNLILRGTQLLEDCFLLRSGVDENNSQIQPKQQNLSGKIFIPRTTNSLRNEPPAGLPLFFGKPNKGISNPSIVPSIAQLAAELMVDPLWESCSLLDTVKVHDFGGLTASSQLQQQSEPFECLPDILLSIATGENVPPTTSSLSSYFIESKLIPPSAVAPAPNRRPVTPAPTPPVPRPNAYTPVPVAPSLDQLPTTDPFRARKGGSSSRAPSKHVDEFEAEQQAAAAAFGSRKPVDQQKPEPDTSATESIEASLSAIPQWAEFVAGGVENGLDVMEILKTPHLLQDPQIESKFRGLVDLHPSIQALFKMMELQI